MQMACDEDCALRIFFPAYYTISKNLKTYHIFLKNITFKKLEPTAFHYNENSLCKGWKLLAC